MDDDIGVVAAGLPVGDRQYQGATKLVVGGAQDAQMGEGAPAKLLVMFADRDMVRPGSTLVTKWRASDAGWATLSAVRLTSLVVRRPWFSFFDIAIVTLRDAGGAQQDHGYA